MQQELILALQNVVETDRTLQHWSQRLSEDYYLELGDDPSLILAIEQDLTDATKRINRLHFYFNVSRVPLQDANKYYGAMRELKKVLELVMQIRHKNRGSRRNTEQCLEQLHNCSQFVRNLGDLLLAPNQETKLYN